MRRVLLLLAALSSIHSLLRAAIGCLRASRGIYVRCTDQEHSCCDRLTGIRVVGARCIVNELDFASVAPRQNYGVVFRRGQFMLVSQLGAAQVSIATLQEPSFAPDGVVWSDDGSVAVLYSQAGSWIQTFTGFPTSVNAGSPISISPLGGRCQRLPRISTAEQLRRSRGRPRRGLRNHWRPRFCSTAGHTQPGWVGVLRGRRHAVCLGWSRESGFRTSIWLAPLFRRGPWEHRMPSPSSPPRNASNLNVLYVAGRSDHLLLAFDPSTHQQITSVPLSFAPTTIEPLGSNSFLLRPRISTSDPLWSFTNRLATYGLLCACHASPELV